MVLSAKIKTFLLSSKFFFGESKTRTRDCMRFNQKPVPMIAMIAAHD